MIEIVIHNPHRVVYTKGEHYEIYDILTCFGVDDEIAIDCSDWCDLACIGESYNQENFDVYIVED